MHKKMRPLRWLSGVWILTIYSRRRKKPLDRVSQHSELIASLSNSLRDAVESRNNDADDRRMEKIVKERNRQNVISRPYTYGWLICCFSFP